MPDQFLPTPCNHWLRILLRIGRSLRIKHGPTIGRKRRARRDRGRARQIKTTARFRK